MKSTVQYSQPFMYAAGWNKDFFFSVLMKQAIANVPSLVVNTHFDANLFAPSRLKAVTKISAHHVCETLYDIYDSFSQTCTNFIIASHTPVLTLTLNPKPGLTISIKKTVILSCFF